MRAACRPSQPRCRQATARRPGAALLRCAVAQHLTTPRIERKSAARNGRSVCSRICTVGWHAWWSPPAGLWILLAASVGVAGVLVVVSQLALVSARRMARSGTFKRARATLRRLQSVQMRRGASGTNGSASAGCWMGRQRQGAASSSGEVAIAMGGLQRHSFSKQDLDGGLVCASGSGASDAASMAQVLAAVQRVEHMLSASQQGWQPEQEAHRDGSAAPVPLPYAASHV